MADRKEGDIRGKSKRRVRSICKMVDRYIKQSWRVSITSEIEPNGEAEIQQLCYSLMANGRANGGAIARRNALRHENDTLLGILDLLASGSSLSL